jgi:hypothetical protein
VAGGCCGIAASGHYNAVLLVTRRHGAREAVQRLEARWLVRALVFTRLHQHPPLVPFDDARARGATHGLEEADVICQCSLSFAEGTCCLRDARVHKAQVRLERGWNRV